LYSGDLISAAVPLSDATCPVEIHEFAILAFRNRSFLWPSCPLPSHTPLPFLAPSSQTVHPSSIILALKEDGYDIRCIRLDAPGISDIEVMRYAHKDKRIILTFDLDFGELAIKDRVYLQRNYSIALASDESSADGRIHKRGHQIT
jgi:hypothetical protein